GLEDDLRAPDVGDERPQGLLDDELDAHRRGQVDHAVDLVDQLVDLELVEHRTVDDGQRRVVGHRGQVLDLAGGQVVEHDDAVAPLDEGLDQVGPDEPGAAGDEVSGAHSGAA